MPHPALSGDGQPDHAVTRIDAWWHLTLMMRRTLLSAAVLALVVAACGVVDQDTATLPSITVTTTGGTGTTTTTTTLAPSSTETTVATTTTLPPDWAFNGQAIFGPGIEAWESNFIIPGGFVATEDTLHMFYMGYDLAGTSVTRGAVGHAESGDGRNWARTTQGPLFDAAELEWTEQGVVVGSALVEPDGAWVLYFHTVPRTLGSRGGSIGRATAPAPSGPWTVHPDPLLVRGPEGAWDAKGLSHPSVVATEDGYRMYYDGHVDDVDDPPDRRIGMATSPDGITWTKHDDPATTGDELAESDPIFGLGGAESWDALRVQHPSVVAVDGGWVMTYTSHHRNPTQQGRVWDFGYATSADGETWERAAANPFFTSLNVYGFITTSTFVIFKDRGLLYFDGAGSITTPANGLFVIEHREPLVVP